MKTEIIKLSIIALVAFSLSACSHILVGTWNVQRFEITTPGEDGIILNNIGTIKFKKDFSGIKDVKYTVLGVNNRDQIPFKWIWSDEGKFVTIESEGSDFGKTWIITQSKKGYQKWESTDGANKVQILELNK